MNTRNLLLRPLAAILLLSLAACQSDGFLVKVTPNLEDIAQNGYRYTPSTQSFLRGHHWLEEIDEAIFSVDNNNLAHIQFDVKSESDHYFNIKNVPLDQLVPRLHYSVGSSADEFDYFNLMLAEYSRNGLSFPFGHEGDAITHFQTNLKADIPWKLTSDYDFKPNPTFKPIRFSVVNNCLNPGLWEMNATDKTGEVYHSWFSFPKEKYYNLVSKVNGLDQSKVEKALEWKDALVKIDLDRLRKNKKEIGTQSISVIDEPISYSSQGSRRKLSKGFVTCKSENDQYVAPMKLTDVLRSPVKMAKFEPPGKYSIESKMDFDFKDYERPINAIVREVEPLTQYDFNEKEFTRDNFKYVEIEINLPENQKLIVGNLPLNLIVQQEDYSLHGFGVGILSASGFAERRKFLLDQGYHPSFAYLAKSTDNGLVALNSHNEGLEQIFIRSYPNAEQPHWDVTFTSYERITDIVKYRIPIPSQLVQEQIAQSDNYITPVYFSYRDDNIR